MRYPADHREKTRQRILDAAGIVFRRCGFQAASVDDIMSEAGLTAGGFYSHFKSKDELFADVMIQLLKQGQTLHGQATGNLEGIHKIRAIVGRYLSEAHRKRIDQGCPLPPLLADLPRQKESTRLAFQEVLLEIAEELNGFWLSPSVRTSKNAESSRSNLRSTAPSNSLQSDRILGLLALLIGGISLSRAVVDNALGDRILAACRDLIDGILQHDPAESSLLEPVSAPTAAPAATNHH